MIRWLLRQNAIDVLFVVISTAVVLLFISMLPWPEWPGLRKVKRNRPRRYSAGD